LNAANPAIVFPLILKGRQAVGHALLGLGQHSEDRLPQRGQGGALRLLLGIQVLVDLLSGHSPSVLTSHGSREH
jgi:hypothetical protein